MKAFENSKLQDSWEKQVPAEARDSGLVLYFSSTARAKNENIYSELRQQYPHAIIVGCSTGGEIQGDEVHDNSIVTTALSFKATEIKLAQRSVNEKSDSFDLGKALGNELTHPSLKCMFVVSDGLQINGSELVRGITSITGTNIPVTGGLAGDGDRFTETYVSANAPAEKGIVAAIGLYGDKIHINHGCIGGWDAFGPERIITKSKSNILYELDGKPALEIYKTYLGEEAEKLPGSGLLFPLTIRSPQGDHTVVRTILGVNEDDNSMTFAGDLPEGYHTQFMRGNLDRLVEGAAQAAHNAAQQYSDTDTVALLVSCIGRKLLMGQRTTDEVEAVRGALGEHIKMLGFYSYGEISPHSTSGICELHNQTMTITTLTESA